MKTILHVIDSLETGGAEKILVGAIKSMPGYRHTIVSLTHKNDFVSELQNFRVYTLNYRGKFSLPRCVLSLKNIIKKNNIDLIHSHLLTASFLSRLSKPNKIPLVFSVHSILSEGAFKISKLSKILESLFYKKNQYAIFVSKCAMGDYDQAIGLRGNYKVIYNFIDDVYFTNRNLKRNSSNSLKMVAVGSLKAAKNYKFLIESLKELKGVTLDIYGDGPLKMELQEFIKNKQLEQKVKLKGKTNELHKLLPRYDLFVMASLYEGFGIAPMEAMGMGLPTLLSDIPTHREIYNDVTVFFDPKNKADFIEKINTILTTPGLLHEIAKKGNETALSMGRKELYIHEIHKIYERLLN